MPSEFHRRIWNRYISDWAWLPSINISRSKNEAGCLNCTAVMFTFSVATMLAETFHCSKSSLPVQLTLEYAPVSAAEERDYAAYVEHKWHWIEDPIRYGAQNNSIILLEWALISGRKRDDSFYRTLAAGGNIAIMRWAARTGTLNGPAICCGAAMGGHLKILAWARVLRLGWDEQVCIEAARGGHRLL